MSATMPFLETKPSERSRALVIKEEDVSSVLHGLGAIPKKQRETPDVLAKSHTELSKLLWARTLMAKSLIGASFRLEEVGGTVYVAIDRPIERQTVPWAFSGKDLRRFALFSTNDKMQCPTWDLPTGIAALGGTCPGARYAQSSISEAELKTDAQYNVINAPDFIREQVKADGGNPNLNLKTTVCTYCYASGGKYGESVVQFSEVARLAFVNGMMRTKEGTEQLVDLIVRTLETTKLEWKASDIKRHGIRAVRVHSAGDFFSTEYAEMWLEVARRLWVREQHAKETGEDYAPVRLWAPTRTHVLAGFDKFWRDNRHLISPNFIIRPSGYSIGDPAPFIARESPTGSKGTSVLFHDDAKAHLKRGDKQRGDGVKYHWQCGVYALEKGNKTCLQARAPDGKTGCRACWKFPNMTINYVAH